MLNLSETNSRLKMAVSPRVVELIQIAKSWDYKEVSDKEIIEWLDEVCPQMYNVEIHISAPVSIVRARCEYDYTKKDINYPCNISFPPEPKGHEKNKIRRGRCNIEDKAVFYGVIKEPEQKEGDAIKVAVKETSRLYHGVVKEKKEDAVVSNWQVKKKFSALMFVHHEAFAKPHSLLAELREKFESEIQNDPQRDDLMELVKFFSSEFAKSVGNNCDHEYRLTSLFANLHFMKGCDAILYPSVRENGEFLNVAIRKELADPESNENALELIEAKIIWIQKLGYTLECIDYKHAKNLDIKSKFDFHKVKTFYNELGELLSQYLIEKNKSVLYVMPR
jgi:hypothetical protein